MDFFNNLGSLIEERWKDSNYAEELFPEIAARALAEADTNRHVSPWQIIRWLHSNTQLPRQQDADGKFGDPPITLYSAPRFYIDVYFWLYGTTSVHQHGFAGAFQVLLGSSIHSRYSFEREQKINAHFSTGRMILNEVELLTEGNIRQIHPGRELIHSLFHLDRPSATVTVRTYQSPSAQPQYNFLAPYIAVDPFYKEQSITKKVQSVSLLLTIKHPEADSMIADLIAGSDFHTAFSVLEVAFKHLTGGEIERLFRLSTGRERFNALVEKARRRHGDLVDLIPPVLEEVQRKMNLANRRRYLTSSEQQFFLALLLNVPHRRIVLDLVGQRFPDRNPVDTICNWVMELARTRVLGWPEPNILGIDGFDEDSLFVFRRLLEGDSVEETRAALYKEYSAERAKALESKLGDLCSSLRDSILLGPLLFDSSSADATAEIAR